MKRILCILMLLSGVVYAQETEKKSSYRPHSIAISQRLGGAANHQTAIDVVGLGADSASGGFDLNNMTAYTGYNHYGAYSTQFEFFTQRRKGRSQYTPMVAFRLIYAGDSPNALSGFHYGFLFGGSQYLFDFRSKELGTGWSMMANGGFTVDLGNFSDATTIEGISIPNGYPVILGGEVDFKAIYNFTREIGVTFGLNMGYNLSAGASVPEDIDAIGPGVPQTAIIFDHSFVWALNFGIIF